MFLFKINFYYSRITLLHSFLVCSQRISDTHTHPLLFGLPSHSAHHGALSRDPCAMQPAPITHLFHAQQCLWVNTNLPVQSPPPSPLLSMCSSSTSVLFICVIFLGSTCKNSKGKGESGTEKWFFIAFPMYSLKVKLFQKVKYLNHNYVGNKNWWSWPWDPSSFCLSCLSNVILSVSPRLHAQVTARCFPFQTQKPHLPTTLHWLFSMLFPSP